MSTSSTQFQQVMSPGSSDIKHSITPLSPESNFRLWKYQLEYLFTKFGFFSLLNDTYSGSEAEKAVLDVDAKFTLVKCVDDSYKEDVMNASTTKAAYDHLVQMFETEAKASAHQLFAEIINLPFEGSGSAFIARIKSLFLKLANVDQHIREDMQINMTLAKLPAERYGTLKDKMSLDENKTWSHFQHCMISFESSNRVATRPKDVALKVSQSFKCRFCGGVGHVQKKCKKFRLWVKNRESSNARDPSTQPKHFNFKSKVKPSSNTSKSEATGFMTSTKVVYNSGSINFVLDSGASRHIIKDANVFVEMHSCDPVRLTIANGEVELVELAGTIRFCHNGNTLSFEDCLYSPNFSENLISVKELVNNNCTVQMNQHGLSVLHGEHIVISSSENKHIFTFSGTLCTENAYISKETEEHNRHGHLGFGKDCVICNLTKQKKTSLKLYEHRTKYPLEKVHADLVVGFPVSVQGYKHLLVLTDDFTRFTRVYPLKTKASSEVLVHIQDFARRGFLETKYRLLSFHSDNGGEFTAKEVTSWLFDNGVIQTFSNPEEPAQNGLVERSHQTLQSMCRAMLRSASAPQHLWAECIVAAAYVRNRLSHSGIQNQIPIERWLGHSVSSKHLRTWGCMAFVHEYVREHTKLGDRSLQGVFVGYEPGNKGYRVLLPDRTIRCSKQVTFIEHRFPFAEPKERTEEEPSTAAKPAEVELPVQVLLPPAPESIDSTVHSDSEESSCEFFSRYISRAQKRKRDEKHRPKVVVSAAVAYAAKQLAINDAINSKESQMWREACMLELTAMKDLNVYNLVDLPRDADVIGTRWVLTTKEDADGNTKYKARLVAQGYSQQEGFDYNETYAPVIRFESIRLLLAISAHYRLTVHQFDVSTAFLYGKIQETVYVKQPPLFGDNSSKVWQLNKSLYGLKQAPRCWNMELHSTLTSMGFCRLRAEMGLYTKRGKHSIILFGVYVDDFLVSAANEEDIAIVKDQLMKNYKVKHLGPARKFLGMDIVQNKQGIELSQKSYLQKILSEFHMDQCNPVKTPMEVNGSSVDDTSPPFKDITYYRSMIGSLMYALSGSRPDIAYAVGYLSRFMEHPTVKRVEQVRRVFRYLKGTLDYTIKYPFNTPSSIRVYCDSSLGNEENRASSWGYVLLFGSSPVCWKSKKHTSTRLSTAEAEYVAMAEAAREIAWFSNLYTELGIDKRMTILQDNKSAINMANKPKFSTRTRYIELRYHYLSEQVSEGKFTVEYVPTTDQVADLFTKPLARNQHDKLTTKLMSR